MGDRTLSPNPGANVGNRYITLVGVRPPCPLLCCRDSKLTRLLQQSLGGNSVTVAVCNISIDALHVGETKSTLRFASFTKKVQNNVKKNEAKATAERLKQYRTEIEDLKKQLNGGGLAEKVRDPVMPGILVL